MSHIAPRAITIPITPLSLVDAVEVDAAILGAARHSYEPCAVGFAFVSVRSDDLSMLLKSCRRTIATFFTLVVAGVGLMVAPVADAAAGNGCHASSKCHTRDSRHHHRAARVVGKRSPRAHRTKASKPAKGHAHKPAPVKAGHPNGPITQGAPAPAPTAVTPTPQPVAPATPVAPDMPATSPAPVAPSAPATSPDTSATTGVGTVTSTALRFFSPTSIWNAPLLPNAPIASNSAAIEGTLQTYINSSLATRTGPWINTTQYSTPIYTVPANQPTVPVIMDYNNPLASAMSAVPLPANALPASGTDEEMTVYQPSSDTLWEMWAMRQRLNPPPYLVATVGTGGSLSAGTYYYAVTALTPTGETTVSSVQSSIVAAGATVKLSWGGPVGATAYRIYRGTSRTSLQSVGSLAHITTHQGDSGCFWTDTGGEMPSAVSPPTTNTATTPGQWHASWGGRMSTVSQDPGYYRNIANPLGGWAEQSSWGVTASGLPVVGGLITLADLASGKINHAIAVMVPQAAKGVFTFPAQRTDGVSTLANAIPEGARFRLPPNLNLAAIPMPAVTREIAQAAQTYGLIVNDQTGATVGFRAEDPMPLIRQGQPNPYLKYFSNPTTGAYIPPNDLLASFPWSDLELVAPGQ
jgi:hypothetical protein